jgi:hypothetical protein
VGFITTTGVLLEACCARPFLVRTGFVANTAGGRASRGLDHAGLLEPRLPHRRPERRRLDALVPDPQHGETSRVSAYFFLTPAFGLLLSAILLGEHAGTALAGTQGTMKNDDLATSRSQQVLELVRSWAEEESRCESTVFDDSSGWFRLTLTAVRNGDRWEIAGLHLSPSRKRSIATCLKSAG